MSTTEISSKDQLHLIAGDLEYVEEQLADLNAFKETLLKQRAELEGEEEPVELSKKERNKLAKKQKKIAAQQAREQKAADERQAMLDANADIIGYRPVSEVISDDNPKREYLDLCDVSKETAGTKIWVRGRIHSRNAVGGNLCFYKLRDKYYSIQVVISAAGSLPKELVTFAKKIPTESIVDIYGTFTPVEEPTTCSISELEIAAEKVFIVSEALSKLPIQVEDISRPQPILDAQKENIAKLTVLISEKQGELKNATGEAADALKEEIAALTKQKSEANKYPEISQSLRLDYRVIDIRAPAQMSIFKISTAIQRGFRDFVLGKGFTEIHSPKILGGTSEGGSEVFNVTYFGKRACLAQSPQLYKQMSIVGDLGKVFEIGPVFRAEKSDTYRHLTEFVGMDIEMEFKQHYHEVLHFIGQMLIYVFSYVQDNYQEELSIINEQYPITPLVFPKDDILILRFSEGIKLLHESGFTEQQALDDLSTPAEKALGKLVKEKYGTDLYILDKFPRNARSFYTMPDPEHEDYSNGYDIFLRGEEISSGAQRVHTADLLAAQATAKGVPPSTIAGYIDSMSYGASPHAGCGLGLERVVMFFLGIGNVRKVSMFPRDMYRLTP